MKLGELYPFNCIKIDTNEKEILNLYNKKKEEGLIKGFTPIIIEEDIAGVMEENIKFILEDYGSFYNFTKKCLKEYKNFNINDFFCKRKLYYDSQEKFEILDGDSIYEFNENLNFNDNVKKIYLGEVPTRNPYEVMAYIPMGGFGDCPDNITHISIAKLWYDEYKAVPFVISSDGLIFKCDETIKGEKDLETLAFQQYLYCGNIIWQGVETLNNLKNILSYSKFWHFWWNEC